VFKIFTEGRQSGSNQYSSQEHLAKDYENYHLTTPRVVHTHPSGNLLHFR